MSGRTGKSIHVPSAVLMSSDHPRQTESGLIESPPSAKSPACLSVLAWAGLGFPPSAQLQDALQARRTIRGRARHANAIIKEAPSCHVSPSGKYPLTSFQVEARPHYTR